MLAVFRADASFEIGTGHVMRCITVAKALQSQNYEILFLCRNHPGNLISDIMSQGFEVAGLGGSATGIANVGRLAHAAWLGVSQSDDARQSMQVIEDWLAVKQADKVDLLVVDHYALDQEWEKKVKTLCAKSLVIDDLADRQHDCDMLLDQSFMRQPESYLNKVPAETLLLLGTDYGLLRPEFAAMRPTSLLRRQTPTLKNILISMGGVDKNNFTREIIQQLSDVEGSQHFAITVVLGASSPWHDDISRCVAQSRLNIQVLANVSNMAHLLTNCDVALGAAGASTWERCTLGVPTLMFVLASNQLFIAEQLVKSKAVILANPPDESFSIKALMALLTPEKLISLSRNAALISDGSGVARVISQIEKALS
ncbi:UDP-2,4-diacetamido-2,4,6-trideoxy-beta-L-altropyranose hydrolase [Neptunomonas qingdaonensis]|uniref:UDP-2,4-diacetamido-2,4,6-trideoxy-beta-L-altropyranose hydrolase n=1 Tax=Neptunomonas qingdaonensis TaxID=1045558 RepID=A0A1I2PT00_9GAMM|nr:UDP-2,4-diacetamido-2,4,6-trideoxy-beta-L-altropyranose hydrolase [Neptunomonas qingdaonensis]SFG19252.1 UDP-2,4-diacetamido-2,4,6-trideoxy-beta-L-altropyranose hydrolase [Neptunomonas qingdaonensis]